MEVIPPKYKSATNFIDGQSTVKTSYNSPEICIDKTGKEIKTNENKNADDVIDENKVENKSISEQKNTVKNLKQTKSLNSQTTKQKAQSQSVVQHVKQAPSAQVKPAASQAKPVEAPQNNQYIDDFMN